MRRNNKQLTTQFILLGLLLIGVVYAILQANLQINGTAKIQANTWDIHFDNIVVNENSVSIGTGDSPATIDPNNNCKVDFEVTLSLPGDFYEFTIDVVNAGTIDGMIGEINKTLIVNNEPVDNPPDYLDYTVIYSDGVEIESNHKITSGATETYLVRLEFKKDIEELPTATTISTSLTPQYIQADTTAIRIPHLYLYDVLKNAAIDGSNLAKEYTDDHKDSFTNNGTEKIYHWYASSDNEANIIKEKWNVIFGGFCWQMYRTTDTGGVRILYAGIPNEGACNTNGSIGRANFNDSSFLPYVGYMYNINQGLKTYKEEQAATDSIFGSDVSYSEGLYRLTNTSTSIGNRYHYTCNNNTGTCNVVRYYYIDNYYVELSNGKKIDQALHDTLYADNVNQTDSVIKAFVDAWYQNNMTSYTSKLEDTIFCNDRRISNLGGWNPNGGGISYGEIKFVNLSGSFRSLDCANETDQFSISNPKAQLTFPVGLMTAPEIRLINNTKLFIYNDYVHLMSPYHFNTWGGAVCFVGNNGGLCGTLMISAKREVRPVVSLKPDTIYISGDGSKDNPYIIK